MQQEATRFGGELTVAMKVTSLADDPERQTKVSKLVHYIRSNSVESIEAVINEPSTDRACIDGQVVWKGTGGTTVIPEVLKHAAYDLVANVLNHRVMVDFAINNPQQTRYYYMGGVDAEEIIEILRPNLIGKSIFLFWGTSAGKVRHTKSKELYMYSGMSPIIPPKLTTSIVQYAGQIFYLNHTPSKIEIYPRVKGDLHVVQAIL